MVIFSFLCLIHLWIISIVSLTFLKRSAAGIYFAVFLIFFSFIHIQHILLQSGLLPQYPYLDPTCGITISLCFPFYYLYVKTLCYNNKPKDFYHLLIGIPALVNLFYLLLFKNSEELQNYYYRESYTYTIVNSLLLFGMCLIMLFYLWLSNIELKRFDQKLMNKYSDIEKYRMEWLNKLNKLLMFLGVVIAPILILVEKQNWSVIVMGTYTSAMYIFILYKSFNSPTPKDITLKESTTESRTPRIPFEKEDDIHHKLTDYLQKQKPWLDPDLSLKAVAKYIDVSTHQVSYVINKKFEKNFFDLINEYRVAYAKNKLSDPELKKITLEEIGELCGFGSKPSFNRAFKKSTGMNPSEFRKESNNKTQNEIHYIE